MGVGFYKGVAPEGDLPHPPIPLAVFLVVERAIVKAWELLVAHPKKDFDLIHAIEDEVTFELYRCLVNVVLKQRLVPGFDREILSNVVRAPHLENFDQSTIDKMPDLVVLFAANWRPTSMLPNQDAIMIECKPVDLQHPTGKDYCNKGIIRYVNGDYAWAMTGAIMVGYARTEYKIVPKLHDALISRRDEIPTIQLPSPCQNSAKCSLAQCVHITEHSRAFCYLQNGTAAPPITLRHLWLIRD